MTSEGPLQSTEETRAPPGRSAASTDRSKSTRNTPSPSAPVSRPSELVSARILRTTARLRSGPKLASREEHTAPASPQNVRRVALAPDSSTAKTSRPVAGRALCALLVNTIEAAAGGGSVGLLPANGLSYVRPQPRTNVAATTADGKTRVLAPCIPVNGRLCAARETVKRMV